MAFLVDVFCFQIKGIFLRHVTGPTFCQELERLFPTEIGEHLPNGSFGLVERERFVR